jgi:hypothetical protein
MKISRYNCFLFLFVLITLNCCNTGKNIENLKSIKKSIDTLAILTPYVDINIIDKDLTLINDSLLDKKLIDTSFKSISRLLKKKYIIKEYKNSNNADDSIDKEINELFLKLNNLKNPLPSISLNKNIFDSENYKDYRYFILTYIYGSYKSMALLDQEAIELLPTIAISMVLSKDLPTLPDDKANSTMYVLLYDKFESKILYYKSCPCLVANSTFYSITEKQILECFKTIYYK